MTEEQDNPKLAYSLKYSQINVDHSEHPRNQSKVLENKAACPQTEKKKMTHGRQELQRVDLWKKRAEGTVEEKEALTAGAVARENKSEKVKKK